MHSEPYLHDSSHSFPHVVGRVTEGIRPPPTRLRNFHVKMSRRSLNTAAVNSTVNALKCIVIYLTVINNADKKILEFWYLLNDYATDIPKIDIFVNLLSKLPVLN